MKEYSNNVNHRTSSTDGLAQYHNAQSQRNSIKWIREADILGCFDNISHDRVMQHIPCLKKVLTQWRL